MKRIFVSLCALFTMMGSALADDQFSIDNLTLPQNSEAEVVVKFSLDAGSTCSGYTFWLQLPEQLEFVTTDGSKIKYTLGDSYDATPTLTPNISDGYLKVACLNADSDPLNKQTGTLVTFYVKVKDGESVNVDDVLNCQMTQATISSESGDVHNVADDAFTVTIDEPADLRTVLDENSTTAPTAASGVDIRVKRTINADVWSTICLPFAMSEAQVKAAFGNDVELADFTSWSSEEDGEGDIIAINVGFTNVSAIEANHPYIIKVSAPVSEFTVDNVDIAPEEEPTKQVGTKKANKGFMIGTYTADTTVPGETLFINNGEFWYSTGLTQSKAFRAYFEFADVLKGASAARLKARIVIGDASITGIESMHKAEDGCIELYNMNGSRVERAGKGVYIKNGKKIINK